jgi:hypothetical protein
MNPLNNMVTIALWIIGGIFFVWCALLTVLFVSLYRHYNIILQGTTKKTLQGLLESLTKDVSSTQTQLLHLKDQCERIEKESTFHIQKIGLVRFNPFHDTGGDQSFVLSFLDAHNTGIVLSGLYSRSGVRWYAKNIINGKGVEHSLSAEEKKAIESAKELTHE